MVIRIYWNEIVKNKFKHKGIQDMRKKFLKIPVNFDNLYN